MSALRTLLAPILLVLILSVVTASEGNPVPRDFKPRRFADEPPQDPNKDVVTALIKRLKDSDKQVRIYAASALCTLDTSALPALVELVEGNDTTLRIEAAMILGKMGTMGRRHQAALPALTKALDADDAEVRRAAAYAISQIVVTPQPQR